MRKLNVAIAVGVLAVTGGVFLIFKPAHGELPKHNVCVNAAADDDLGKQLVYRIKEEFDKSTKWQVSDRCSFSFIITTVNADRTINPQARTAYAYTITMTDPRVYQQVYRFGGIGIVGSQQIEVTATRLVVEWDGEWPSMIKDYESWFEQMLKPTGK